MCSVELEGVDHPSVVATNLRRKDSSKAALAVDMNRKAALQQLKRSRPSSQFLEIGYHCVMHDFPWKMEELFQDLDAPDGDAQPDGSNLFSPMSRRSRLVSDGSEDVFEPDPISEMMMIEMEEDRNEEHRRIQANYKWNLRRQKIENEFLRLRHLSINRHRAAERGTRLRHSVSFGDDLEIQLEKSGMRGLEKDSDEEVEGGSVGNGRSGGGGNLEEDPLGPMKRERSLTAWSMGNLPTKPYGRTMSMPSKDFDHILSRTNALGAGAQVPSLATHQEFTEEEEEEEGEGDGGIRREREGVEEEEGDEEGEAGMLGLPPKDVPNLSMDQLDQEWAEPDLDDIDYQ